MNELEKIKKIDKEIDIKFYNDGLTKEDIKNYRRKIYKIDCSNDGECLSIKSILLEALKELNQEFDK